MRRNIEFKRLTDVEQSEIIELMNNPLVRRQMPLAPDPFVQSDCEAFVAAKEQFWADYGYGPSAFVVDGRFAGWGGLQPEGGEADVGLVLHPDYWGLGKHLFAEIIFRAFGEMGFDAVTVLLPPTRTKIKGILRFGFKPDGTIEIEQRQFLRYRLKKSDARGLW
ncbi:GNAT family N-acetyltransferase [Lentisalinibacter salinarum]|uniref:GNAT family N-acetyltransferase n=1 Tax=Lentisalinibacter salinarum TaxID=2992239 RepID=UPI003868AE7A